MSPGIYAVGSFAGEAVDPADCQILGIDPSDDAFVGTARDFPGTSGTVDRHDDGTNVVLFVGRLHDGAKLAAELDCIEAGPAEIALAALLRWGTDVGARMPGEWSLLHWNALKKRLQIATSYRLRDRFLIAQAGSRFAVAPNLRVLSKLAWIENTIDPEGLAYELSPQRFRLGRQGHTVLRQVRQVEAGQFVILDANGKHVARRPRLEAIPWQGSFDDGIAAATDTLRRIIRRTIAPYRRIGVLLSGGLDSTLIAAIAAEELRSDQTLTGFTSVAPPGTGLIDEHAWTQHTADHLGIELIPIWPSDDCGIYQPTPQHFENGPTRSVRHYLYMALFGTAHERGVELMLDGEYGESALSRTARFATPMNRMRAASRSLRERLGLCREAPPQRFMVHFASQFVTDLPAQMRGATPGIPIDWVSPAHAIGFTKGQPGFGAFPTADTGFELRRANPCLGDFELLRLVAGMPASFLRRNGYDRALIRAMLAGRVPDETRLRTEKRAFSPDYYAKLIREAAPLQSRVDAWRAAGVGEMLDLDWMGKWAGQLAGGDLPSRQITAEFHLTVMAAEFLLWWYQDRLT